MTKTDTSTEAVERLAELQEDDLVRPDGYIAADTIRALVAERDELRREVADARNAALEDAKAAVREECLAPEGTYDPVTESEISACESATVEVACEAIEALKSGPAPRQSVKEAAWVEPDRDIAGEFREKHHLIQKFPFRTIRRDNCRKENARTVWAQSAGGN